MSELAKQRFVYAGQRGNKKRFDSWFLLPEDGNFDGAKKCNYPAGKKGLTVGAKYEFSATANGSRARPGEASFIAMMVGDEWRERTAAWQLDHDAAQVGAILARLEQTGKHAALLEQLRPLRHAYRATNHQGRLAMEVLILSYLRMGGD